MERTSSFSYSEIKETELNKNASQVEIDEGKIKINPVNYETIYKKTWKRCKFK